MPFIDGLEAPLDFQESCACIVTFSAAKADLARHVTHDEIVPAPPINILDMPVLKVGASANMADCLAHFTFLASMDPETWAAWECTL
jgi:hypothetical protein